MQFSIVTPTRNSERYLAETIESVIFQRGDFEIRYVVVDNQSTDRTGEIAAYYQRLLASGSMQLQRRVTLEFVSEPDNGMYDAINQGFGRSEGHVMAWINSDDVYLPGAFAAVSRSLRERPEIEWLKGITSYVDENSEIVQAGQCYLYDRRWIREGYYGPVFPFIQQDSVFWRRALWNRIGGCDANLRLCGDYFLWRDFARITPLFALPRYLSCFRRHSSQLSTDIRAYWREAANKDRLAGLHDKGFLTRCMKSVLLPKGLRLAIRRAMLGAPQYHFLPRSGAGGAQQVTGTRGDLIEDRVTSAVLL